MPHRLTLLTARERQVLRLVAAGLPSSAIAGELMLSVHTVRVHRVNLLRKLQVRNSAEMMLILHAAEARARNDADDLLPNARRR
ncbi:hypothetical protein CDN99_25480 [Roseateles aquatilis]|uniref:HTH luxR-type domain-containing protein n=1 Tax=Roseateles aquatilis TaxID=431061 RepID=A0A246IUC6_9BURK|nr:helix-turn-helix transcriptional regulator [Roseateles aquatilis]OWQ83820.1 hypothetical protein CDN99_25480 [Roseateles aquatilis]